MKLRAELVANSLAATIPANTIRYSHVRIRNLGSAPWESGEDAPALELHIDGGMISRVPLLANCVESGDVATFSFGWRTPESLGKVNAEFVLSGPLRGILRRRPRRVFPIELELVVPDDDRTEPQMRSLFSNGAWHWLPSGGVRLSQSGGRYPTIIDTAAGATICDADGRKWVDWIMGWGTCLLGYSDERVSAAVTESMQRTSLCALPSSNEVELAQKLCARLPGAEMAVFGKNGSDACTAAVRMARAFTGRPIVLHCGYHGWHDWYVERRGVMGAGVPARETSCVYDFLPGDLVRLDALLEQHAGQVACVILEPSAQIMGVEGPVYGTDAEFLQSVQDRCHHVGALLVFDEIFTAFRHAGGSVQQATGVQPDLTCLGKALANGHPIAAVVGRGDVFEESMGRIAFDATFKGEPHALAASLCALSIYDSSDVPSHVERVAQALNVGIRTCAEQCQIPVDVIGAPLRMTVAFPTAGSDGVLWRTLLQQELLLRGVLTFRGLMLPSAAHGEQELAVTLEAFAGAFAALRAAIDRGELLQRLEIPLVN